MGMCYFYNRTNLLNFILERKIQINTMLKGYREFPKFLMLYWTYYDFKVMNHWVYSRYNSYFLYLDDDFFPY